jgi:hypothetical protein
MFGTNHYSNGSHETASNQAHLEYYTDDATRKKYDAFSNGVSYWTASPFKSNPTHYCTVKSDGTPSNVGTGASATNVGIAPAFCVK